MRKGAQMSEPATMREGESARDFLSRIGKKGAAAAKAALTTADRRRFGKMGGGRPPLTPLEKAERRVTRAKAELHEAQQELAKLQ
jgi:hypothetical protein